MRGDDIDDVYTDTNDFYTPQTQITNWTRDVVFLRPSVFVVYDRTTVSNTTGDQHMSWHLFFTPQAVTSPAGSWRYDVTNPTNGFLGSMTTVLPTVPTAPAAPIDIGNTHKVYRVEVRPQTPATSTNWLTVFETGSDPTAIALASVLPSASANIKGTLLKASAGNSVVAFGSGAASTNIAGPVSFTIPPSATKVVIADLPPSTGFSVGTAPSGTNRLVTIQTGSGFQTTANGTLYVNIAANGGVSAGN
jgi:hypothetical protein